MPRSAGLRTLRVALAALLVWALPLAEAPAQEGPAFRIIVHSSVSADSLSEEEASDYFLKKVSVWKGDGTPVRPITLIDRELTDSFSRAIHHRNGLAIRKYWQRQVFTGRGTPPPEVRTVEEVLSFVSSNPGAIGYVPAGTDLSRSRVRVVQIESG